MPVAVAAFFLLDTEARYTGSGAGRTEDNCTQSPTIADPVPRVRLLGYRRDDTDHHLHSEADTSIRKRCRESHWRKHKTTTPLRRSDRHCDNRRRSRRRIFPGVEHGRRVLVPVTEEKY
jgi:hypothetical protein